MSIRRRGSTPGVFAKVVDTDVFGDTVEPGVNADSHR